MQGVLWGNFSQPDSGTETRDSDGDGSLPQPSSAATVMQQSPVGMQPPDWKTNTLSTAQYGPPAAFHFVYGLYRATTGVHCHYTNS